MRYQAALRPDGIRCQRLENDSVGFDFQILHQPANASELAAAGDAASRVSTDVWGCSVTHSCDEHHYAAAAFTPIWLCKTLLGSRIYARLFLAILVSGGAGYIGSHVARALRRSGYEVVLYDNLSTGSRRLAQGFELVEGDIADKVRLRQVLGRVDAILHFAAHAYVGESVEHPRKYFQNNVLGRLAC